MEAPEQKFPNSNDLRTILNNLQQTAEVRTDLLKHQAEMLKYAFDALVQSGFQDYQALEIIKVRGSIL